MTNKMPVVGKKYRTMPQFSRPYVIEVIAITNKSIVAKTNKYFSFENEVIENFLLDGWEEEFEELLEDNLQQTEEIKVNETIITLEEGLAWLKEQSIFIKERGCGYETKFETLLIALDSFFGMFKPNPVKKVEVNEVERVLEELKSELKDWFESFPDFFLSKPECNHTWAGKRIGDTCEDCDDKFFSKQKPFCQNGVYYTLQKAQNLVNALESEKANRYNNTCTTPITDLSKPEPKINMKEERVESLNIWKDVSELPKICGAVLVKWKNLTGIEMAYFYAGDESFYTDSNCADEDEFVKQNIEKCCLLTDLINSFEQMQKDIEELKRK